MIESAETPRPLLAPDATSIPPTLKERARWAPWRAEWSAKRSKYDKIPHRADRPDYGISTTRPEQWASFDLAWSAWLQHAGKFAGIGYCLTHPHGVIGIDLDNCMVDGVAAPWATEIVEQLASYTEVSPSGRGLRIFGFGEIARDWNNHDVGIEVYGGHEARFLTVTGAHVDGTPDELQALPAALLDALTARYAKERVSADVIDLTVPELLDELALPDVAALALSGCVERFLLRGEHDGDRSSALHATGVALYAAGLDDAVVLSLLAANEHAMGVALDHRRQDHDRALLYLWREHCVKAKVKAKASIASADEFTVIEIGAGEGDVKLPAFRRDNKGRIEAIVENVSLALQQPDVCGMRVGYDEFRDDVMYATRGGSEWQPFQDHHYVDLRLRLERRGFKPISRELIRDVVNFVAHQHRFDSVQDWLNGLAWDGVFRIDSFLVNHFGADDTLYARAASRYLWTALAGRVLEPGVKADMVLILIGLQGTVKSSGIAAMVPRADLFTEISFHERDDDQARRMRGRLLGEIGELRGLHSRELESIKAFITRTHEHWIPKYKEFAAQYPRRIVFIGTTNKDEFLADETGNRRWLPVEVQRVDIKGVRRDREQLWAEARMRFEVSGVEFADAERLAPEVHKQHTISEVWSEAVARWLDEADPLTGHVPRTREFLRVSDVGRGALRLEDRQIGKREEMRICNALRKCNFSSIRVYMNGEQMRVWVQNKTSKTSATF